MLMENKMVELEVIREDECLHKWNFLGVFKRINGMQWIAEEGRVYSGNSVCGTGGGAGGTGAAVITKVERRKKYQCDRCLSSEYRIIESYGK